MHDEYWGTFSIYDHRRPIYRQALVLFDRIVVPVPIRPVGNLTEAEIEQVAQEAQWLKKEGAAEVVDWDPDEFKDWRDKKQGHGEAIARCLVKDPPYATRLMLQEETHKRVASVLPEGVLSVTPVPVYGSKETYRKLTDGLEHIEEKLVLDVLLPEIPVPAPDSDLGVIMTLRQDQGFQAALQALRRWQRETVRDILEQKDIASMKRAAADFKDMVKNYREALAAAKYKKITTTITSLLAVGALLSAPVPTLVAAMAGVAPALFSVREVMRPCWKDLKDKDCFPAGVVIHAERFA
jgi:hypothetical protein